MIIANAFGTAPPVLRTEPCGLGHPAGVTFADDWAPCPRCKFISVACDCDAPRGERK